MEVYRSIFQFVESLACLNNDSHIVYFIVYFRYEADLKVRAKFSHTIAVEFLILVFGKIVAEIVWFV